MKHGHFIAITTALALLSGCAATIDQGGLEERTARAIGRAAGQFTITDRKDESGGRINYMANTKDGASYSCYMYSATGFQQAMSFGQTPHSEAVCTIMAGTSSTNDLPADKKNGSCNALQKAAGQC